MPPFIFAPEPDAVYLSRFDPDQVLSTFSAHGFELDGEYWLTAEHYYQAMKYDKPDHRETIRLAKTPAEARKLGRSIFRRKRRDWKKLREVLMTRAIYTKCRAHAEVAAALLATGDKPIIETSQYDYYWGHGRDRRGHNTYGKVLMNVRAKLQSEKHLSADDHNNQHIP